MLSRGNYWQENLCLEQNPGPCVFVIFGASGDLARRKLFPSLFALCKRGLLGDDTRIIGCARHPYDDRSFRAALADALPGRDTAKKAEFLNRIGYQTLEYGEEPGYVELKRRLDSGVLAALPHLFYLATPATLYPDITRHLHQAGLLREKNPREWRHVVFEKPFGFDAASAEKLDETLHRYLGESQIYRIDHYLGKETVQNILLLRFANLIFEPIWNRNYIDNIQITVSETLGVENRAGYFDQAGILRDMFQNHMLEMLSLVAMECPAAFSADAVRDEKLKLIRSIRPFDLNHNPGSVIRAQYQGYRDEPGIAAGSATETFVAMKLEIANYRWAGVPFYLRAGKKLDERKSEIVVVFKSIPHSIFAPLRAKDFQRDILRLRVQPHEGMALTLQAKQAGPKLCMGALTLNYDYGDAGDEALDAYARLLLDCRLGDQTLFIRSDIIAAAWNLFGSILDFWRETPEAAPLNAYPTGSSGPAAADELLRKDGKEWIESR